MAWTWDPQLTTTFVLFLMYAGYLAFRALSGSSHSLRMIASVIAVIACVNIPIIRYAVTKWGGMHPVVERSGGGGLAPDIKTTLMVCMVAFLLLFVSLLWMACRVRLQALRADALYVELAEREAAARV